MHLERISVDDTVLWFSLPLSRLLHSGEEQKRQQQERTRNIQKTGTAL